MQQGDLIRPLSLIAAAGAGAGLALGGAALTGNLGNTTTIQQIVPASEQAASAAPSAAVGCPSSRSTARRTRRRPDQHQGLPAAARPRPSARGS